VEIRTPVQNDLGVNVYLVTPQLRIRNSSQG